MGCNWCNAGMATSFCTSISNAKDAKCDMSTCATDLFATKVSQCFGGCKHATTCDECKYVLGCGWCHDSKQCMDVGADGKPDGATCSTSFTVGSCDLPCNTYTYCGACTRRGCSWCADNTCKPYTTEDSTCASQCTTANPAPVTKQTVPTNTGASQAMAAISVVLFLALLSF